MLAVFIVLGAIVYFMEQPFAEKKPVRSPELGILFPDFKKEDITRMEFGAFSSKIVLVRENDSWQVLDNDQKFPADSASIDKVFETIQTMEARQLISNNPGKHMSFEVNAPQETQATDPDGSSKPFTMGTLGTEVVLKDQNDSEKVHLFVGKNSSSDFMSTYVRKDKSDAVLLVDGYLKMVFSKPDAAGWKDRTLSRIDKTDLARITLTRGKEQLVFEPATIASPTADSEATPAAEPVKAQASEWKLIQPGDVETDSKQIDRLVGMFTNLQATDFAPAVANPAEYGFEPPEIRAVLTKTDGSDLALVFGAESKERKDQFFAKIEGSDRVYIVPKYRLEMMRKKPAEFGPTGTPTPVSPGSVAPAGPLKK